MERVQDPTCPLDRILVDLRALGLLRLEPRRLPEAGYRWPATLQHVAPSKRLKSEASGARARCDTSV